MISDPNMVRAMNLRADLLFNVYRRERDAGADSLTANEAVLDFSKRLDRIEAEKRAADDAFSRDLEVIRKCMERA